MSDPTAASGGITSYLKGMSPKAKQYLLLGGLGMGFLGLVFGSIALWDKQPPAIPQTTKLDKSRNIVTPGAQVDPRDVWMSQSSQQMKEMDNVIQGLKLKLAEVEQKQAAPQVPSRPASVLPPLPPMPPAQAQAAGPGALPQGPAPSMGRPTVAVPPPLPPLPAPVVPKEPGIAAFEVSDAIAATPQGPRMASKAKPTYPRDPSCASPDGRTRCPYGRASAKQPLANPPARAGQRISAESTSAPR